jgi:rhodanese-related sulfurtransferase
MDLRSMLEAANQSVKTYTTEEAMQKAGDASVVFIDVRDAPELAQTGKIPGALNASRGMLEFLIAAGSPYHQPVFAENKEFVFYCASGGRSALAAKTAQDLGLENVAHVAGGMMAWKEAGGETE